jgi:hypothetical protein
MQKQLSTFAILAAIIATTVLGTTMTYAYAQANPGANDFGQLGARNLADDGQMGTHSSDPSGDGVSDPDPRSGIGNVFNPADPKDSSASKHPSDTANTLCGLFPTNTACTSEVDPGN